MNISETILEQWNKVFLPPFDLIYLDGNGAQLPEDILVMPIDELKANPILYTIDVNTTFAPWNIRNDVKHVAIIENGQFDRLDKDLRQSLLEMQHELGRDNLFDWNDLHKFTMELNKNDRTICMKLLNKMSFQVNGVPWVAFRKNHWQQLPWEFRKKVLVDMALAYSGEVIPNKINGDAVVLNPFIRSYVDQYPLKSGPNCFATTLAVITKNRLSADWIIQQWIHSKTFLMALDQRGYTRVDVLTDWKKVQLKENDVIVWVNEQKTPIHATAAISPVHVFNKDGQTMFNPWLIRNFHELAGTWDEAICHGGEMHHYRKRNKKNDSE